LKFVALPAAKIVGGTKKIGSPYIRPRSLLLKILMGKKQRQNTVIAATGINGVADI